MSVVSTANRSSSSPADIGFDRSSVGRLGDLLGDIFQLPLPVLHRSIGSPRCDLLDRISAAVDAGDTPTIMVLHRQFHFSLYGRTGSKWLPYLIDLLWNHTERYQRLSLAFRHDGADHEHRAVLKALAAGENERAAEALRDHLRTTARLVAEAYRKTADAT